MCVCAWPVDGVDISVYRRYAFAPVVGVFVRLPARRITTSTSVPLTCQNAHALSRGRGVWGRCESQVRGVYLPALLRALFNAYKVTCQHLLSCALEAALAAAALPESRHAKSHLLAFLAVCMWRCVQLIYHLYCTKVWGHFKKFPVEKKKVSAHPILQHTKKE